MRKMVKALSLLLALVCVLSMTVVVNAGKVTVTPYISGSVQQTDIYERTVTITVSNLDDTTNIKVYKEKSKIKDFAPSKSATSYTFTYAVSTNKKDYTDYYKVECYKNSTLLNSKTVYVGSNTYFDIDKVYGDTTKNTGSYDGIITGNTPSYSSSTSGNVIEATPYDPTKWSGYKEDSSIVGLYTVKCSKLNVRAGMSTKTKKVGSLKKGTNVVVYKIDEGWAKIIYDGEYAYVSAKYLKAL